jgi:hypothetical protein
MEKESGSGGSSGMNYVDHELVLKRREKGKSTGNALTKYVSSWADKCRISQYLDCEDEEKFDLPVLDIFEGRDEKDIWSTVARAEKGFSI